MIDAQLIEYLYKALNSEHGVVISTDNPDLLRQKLYAARKTDPDLAAISISTSRTNPSEELWLVNRNVQSERPETHTPPAEE